MNKLQEKTLSKSYKYQGKIINVRLDEAKLANDMVALREVVEHPGGVGIALEDKDGKYFMVRQFRYGQMMETLEFPAGKKEVGEDALVTAMREITEETGYTAENWIYLGEMAPTPAYDTERIAMYHATVKDYVGQHFDEDENIILEKYSIDELVDMIMDHKIIDAKTIGMTFMVKELKNRR
ncbi:MAG: NUDIX hydrolase [Erysipelotrichaceae bacterium]|nr:NUDIX hydrolase [Erysipelotrichaceae bacterium]MDY5251213.1 NUDIX hydrolase [Erysipelotrichaceae bacterium]